MGVENGGFSPAAIRFAAVSPTVVILSEANGAAGREVEEPALSEANGISVGSLKWLPRLRRRPISARNDLGDHPSRPTEIPRLSFRLRRKLRSG